MQEQDVREEVRVDLGRRPVDGLEQRDGLRRQGVAPLEIDLHDEERGPAEDLGPPDRVVAGLVDRLLAEPDGDRASGRGSSG